MKNNEELLKDVQAAMKWHPILNDTRIIVTADKGIITLKGMVESYSQKKVAEEATKKVAGVIVVVENIEIQFNSTNIRTDNEIANEIINAFKWNCDVPDEHIQIQVENGWVTLDGEVEWNSERESTNKSVINLAGVKGITNNITIKSNVHDEIEKAEIENALERNSVTHNLDIFVKVTGNRVILDGSVNSRQQKDEAGNIAWNAPGVGAVDNKLLIEYI